VDLITLQWTHLPPTLSYKSCKYKSSHRFAYSSLNSAVIVHLRCHVHCVSKNDTALACYNLDQHQPILIIFGSNVSKKVAIKWYFIFLPQLTSVSALPGEIRKHENRIFH